MTTQSNKRKVFIQGKEYDSLESAAKAFGKSRNTVDYRLSKGWTPEQAVGLVPPPAFASKTAGISVQVEGREFKTLKEAAKYYNRAYTHVIEMLKKGRSIEQSLGLIKRADTLQSENPELSNQWHPHKNMPLTPIDVSSGSGIKVWWLCSNNHEWEAVINSRNRGHGCPYCAGQKPTSDRNFATEYPELLKELDLIKTKILILGTFLQEQIRKYGGNVKGGTLGKLRFKTEQENNIVTHAHIAATVSSAMRIVLLNFALILLKIGILLRTGH